MSVSARLKKDAGEAWERIFTHPFVEELFGGTLPESRFRAYLLQDYNYLISSIRNFSLLAARAPDEETVRELVEIAYMEASGEFEGYIQLLDKIGAGVEEARSCRMLPAGVSYVNFLLSTSSLKSFQEGIAAVLPCYWSYREMASHHREKAAEIKNELYREWALYYLKDEYIELVERMIALVDRTCEGFPYEKLKEAFMASSRYELNFWDAVYEE